MPSGGMSQQGSQENLANGHRQPGLAVPPWLRAASGKPQPSQYLRMKDLVHAYHSMHGFKVAVPGWGMPCDVSNSTEMQSRTGACIP